MARRKDYPAKKGDRLEGVHWEARHNDAGEMVGYAQQIPSTWVEPEQPSDFMSQVRAFQDRILAGVGPPAWPPYLPPALAREASRRGGVEGVDFRVMDLEPPKFQIGNSAIPLPSDGPTVSRAYVGRIGDRLKELGVEASVLTRGDVKYLAIPLKELTLAEGGAWEDRPHRRTGKKRSRKP